MRAERRRSFDRRLAAVAFADVAGYSRLMALDDVGTVERWKTLQSEVILPQIEEARGRLVETAGDAVLVEFPSAVHALQWACDVQEIVSRRSVSDGHSALRLRIGVNVDDVLVDGDLLSGGGINVASRIHQAAEPGQIVVTGTVKELVANRLPVTFHDIGVPRLKNIERPVRVYGVVWADDANLRGEELHHPFLEWSSYPSIAILPFRVLGPDDDSQIGETIVEEIVHGLSRARALHVIAGASMWRFADRQGDIQGVAAELGVRYVLVGTVRRHHKRLRIMAELVDVNRNHAIWSERFDGGDDEFFDLQARIVATILSSLELRVHQAEGERLRMRQTASLDALECVLRANVMLYDFTPESFALSGRALERALELDPNFARAHSTSAWRLLFMVAEQVSGDMLADAERALAHGERAIELDPTDAFSLAVTGHITSFIHRRPRDGMDLFELALREDPNSALAWALAGDTLSYLGRPDEAARYFRNVWKLNPFDRMNFFWWSGAGIAEFVGGRYEDATAWLKRAFRANPRFVATLRMLAASQALAGELGDARATAQRLLSVSPDFKVGRFVELYPLTRPGDLDRLEQGLLLAGLPA